MFNKIENKSLKLYRRRSRDNCIENLGYLSDCNWMLDLVLRWLVVMVKKGNRTDDIDFIVWFKKDVFL